MLGVDPAYIHVLSLDTPHTIGGVEVTLVDANHCPGAVQLLFQLPDGRRYVHSGDMRFVSRLLLNPHLQRFKGADALFLDTTYCNPRYTFPEQQQSVDYVADTICSLLQKSREDGLKRLFLVSTYVIGKEHILLQVTAWLSCPRFQFNFESLQLA